MTMNTPRQPIPGNAIPVHVISLRADTLDSEVTKFAQVPLRHPVFLNSVPKSGTHLLRNVLRMFVPVDSHYAKEFLQIGTIMEHREALISPKNYLSCGHLHFCEGAALDTGHVRRVLLVRDPYTWVLARLRFVLSGAFGTQMDSLRDPRMQMGDLLMLGIIGVPGKLDPLYSVYQMNALTWLGHDTHLVRFEDLNHHIGHLDAPEAESYFQALLDHCGIAMPQDWRERVRIGSAREQSSTASERLLNPARELPRELPDYHKAMIDTYASPVRPMLGYA